MFYTLIGIKEKFKLNYMEITFKDYLHESCDNAHYSVLSVTAPNSIKGVFNYKFIYHLSFDESSIARQAEEFANELFLDPHLTNLVKKNIAGGNTLMRQAVVNVYKYSYMKAFNFCVMMQETDGNFGGNPMANSIAFGGHVELFRSFYDTFQLGISTKSNRLSALYRTLIIKDYDVKAFKSSKFYQEINQNSRKFYFQNYELERLLQAFEDNASHLLWVKKFNSDFNLKPEHHPLGNACFYSNEDCSRKEVLCVNNMRCVTDTASKFWNIANCIFLEAPDDKFERCNSTPYIYTDSSNLTDEVVYAEIFSITGLNCGDKFSTYGTNPYSNSPTDGGKGPNPNSGGGNPSSGPNKPGPNKVSKPDKPNTPIKNEDSKANPSGGQNAIKKAFVKGVDSTVKTLGELAKDERARDAFFSFVNSYSNRNQNSKIHYEPPKRIETIRYGNQYLPYQKEVVTETFSNATSP